jgi:hypothetical protein
VPPDMMLQWRSFSCRVRSPSVATPAVPNIIAIQQTHSMITTHLLAFMNKGDRHSCRPEFTNLSRHVVANLVLSCDGGHTATVRHSFGRHRAGDSESTGGALNLRFTLSLALRCNALAAKLL